MLSNFLQLLDTLERVFVQLDHRQSPSASRSIRRDSARAKIGFFPAQRFDLKMFFPVLYPGSDLAVWPWKILLTLETLFFGSGEFCRGVPRGLVKFSYWNYQLTALKTAIFARKNLTFFHQFQKSKLNQISRYTPTNLS